MGIQEIIKGLEHVRDSIAKGDNLRKNMLNEAILCIEALTKKIEKAHWLTCKRCKNLTYSYLCDHCKYDRRSR